MTIELVELDSPPRFVLPDDLLDEQPAPSDVTTEDVPVLAET